MGFIPWLEAMEPRWLIVENVNRMKQWRRHNELIKTIESYGYTVNNLSLNSADFGVPQSRKRMFLLCSRYGVTFTKDELIEAYKKPELSASSIIDWSGKYKSNFLYNAKRAKATIERAERAINHLGVGVPFIIVYYGSDYAGGWQTIDTPLRTITTIDRFGLVTWKKREPYLRMLQPSELLSAMGAGQSHMLTHGTRREKIKLCGNGVCSPVMEILFHNIMQKDEINQSKVA
jgi:DNA (cytosine-5)-methyltransferase 1